MCDKHTYYSLGTRWPDLVPVPKLLGDPCVGKPRNAEDPDDPQNPPAWPDEPPLVPTQAHFVHACSNLSALRRNADEVEEEEELGIEVRAAKDFTRADLSMLDLRWADLTAANLRDADLRGVDLTLGSLREADLEGARLRDETVDPPARLRLAGVNLRNTDLAGLDLSGFTFAGGALQDASFVGADLSGADLRQAFVARTDFTDADLTGALLDGTVYDPTTIWPPEPFDPAALGAQDLPDDFVRIEPGTFLWHGGPEVTISRPFLIHKTEVTAGQWREMFPGALCWNEGNGTVFRDGVTCHLSGHHSMAYVNALSVREGLEPCYARTDWPGFVAVSIDCEGYRIPTDAEWEYAARAGETGSVYAEPTGERCSVIPLFQWEQWVQGPVSGPNAWGLHDTYGRYPEWVHHRAWAALPDGAVDPILHPGQRNESGWLDAFARGGGFAGRDGAGRFWNACTLAGGLQSQSYGGSERALRPVRTLRVPPPPDGG